MACQSVPQFFFYAPSVLCPEEKFAREAADFSKPYACFGKYITSEMSVSTLTSGSSGTASSFQFLQRSNTSSEHFDKPQAMPFARPGRKMSGMAMASRLGSISAPSPHHATVLEGSMEPPGASAGAWAVPNRRRSSALQSQHYARGSTVLPPPSRRQSKITETSSSSGGTGGAAGGVGSSGASLPALNDTRRMNLRDIMIWRKFTKNLKQRVVEKQNEQRTFCWLDRSYSRGHRRTFAPPMEVEPTYKMTPDEKPSLDKCRRVVDDYLRRKLCDVKYDDVIQSASTLSRKIADEVKEEVKSTVLTQRYRCVVYVTLGQKMDQGVQVASLCAWDPKSDSYVSCKYENGSMYCIVTVFAVYLE